MKGCSIYIVLVTISLIAWSSAAFVKEFEKLRWQKNDGAFSGDIWVLLIAGSKDYYNYRHQADICHAYQVVHNHGIPDDRIIVMMYDDIAYNEQNPTKGVLINHPDGPDVYHGVPKDYTKEAVTPENFLNILTGNAQAMQGIGSGKVINSGANDHVFVYFSDHGAPGLIAFPSSQLMKDDLNHAIINMYKQKRYAQLVFYVEACESGSMFENVLRKDINVYATTAANPDESSYACYEDAYRGTYLGDRYSVSWLEDSDKENIEKESLHKQYTIVKSETNQSHVMQYGDTSISHEIVGLFQGKKRSSVPAKQLRTIRDDVPSPDVPLHILQHKLDAAKSAEDRVHYMVLLNKEKEIRRRIEWTANMIAYHSAGGDSDTATRATNVMPSLQEFECYRSAIQAFDSMCYKLDNYDYAYRQLFVLGNLCDSGININKILNAIRTICK